MTPVSPLRNGCHAWLRDAEFSREHLEANDSRRIPPANLTDLVSGQPARRRHLTNVEATVLWGEVGVEGTTAPDTIKHGLVVETSLYSRVSDGHCPIMQVYESIRAPIVALYTRGGPSAIAWLVSILNVDAIQRVVFGTWAKGRLEGFKTCLPFLAHLDTTAAVQAIGRSARVVAALFCALPRAVLPRPGVAMFRQPSDRPSGVSSQASTGLRRAALELTTSHRRQPAAVTATQPPYGAVGQCAFDDDESRKSSAGAIDQNRHGISIAKSLSCAATIVLLCMGALACSSRGPTEIPPAPVPSGLVPFTVSAFDGPIETDLKVPNARVVIDGVESRTDGAGNVTVQIPLGKALVTIYADGYEAWGPYEYDVPYGLGTVQASLTQLARPPPVVNPPAKPPTPPTAATCGRLHANGRWIDCANGERFGWAFITSFRLLEQYAHGRAPEAEAALDEAAALGFNGVRVLAMAAGMFQLSPDDGHGSLPTLFAAAQARGLYVEIVALADTASFGMRDADLRAQVQTVSEACWVVENCVFQIANEHYHTTQDSRLHDIAYVSSLASSIQGVLYTVSPSLDDEADNPQGQYITRHLDRGRSAYGGWDNVRRVKELQDLSSRTGKPVINDEPMGAGEPGTPRRISDPAWFWGYGYQSATLIAGGTFHCESCLRSEPLGARQREAAQAFMAGYRTVPLARYKFQNTRWAGGPVAEANFYIDKNDKANPNGTVLRLYSACDSDRHCYLIGTGMNGSDPGIQWSPGWRIIKEIARQPNAIVWEVGQ